MVIKYGQSPNEFLTGTSSVDWLFGHNGNEGIYGYEGNDNLYGNGGNDELWGDTGTDNLKGGDGNDTLNGGFGNDFLWGGKDNDTFVLELSTETSMDFIVDYESGDTLNVPKSRFVTSKSNLRLDAVEGGYILRSKSSLDNFAVRIATTKTLNVNDIKINFV